MNEVEAISSIGREMQHGEEKVVVGEWFQRFLDRARKDALVAAVAKNVSEALPRRSVALDYEDSLMVHAPPTGRSGSALVGKSFAIWVGVARGRIKLFTYVLVLSQETVSTQPSGTLS